MEEIWEEKMKMAFEEIIEETFGIKITKSACFGYGDGYKFCEYCGWQGSC